MPLEPKSLAAWLQWLSQPTYVHVHPDLNIIGDIANELGLLPFPSFVITVAGTNGKGSCVAMLEAILSAQGYRIGSFTSPHLLRYNERIRLQGQEIDDATLCAAFKTIEHARGEHRINYFVFATLAALWIFAQRKLDLVILEVGVGGRLDPVNVIDADLAVITSIGLDHQQTLGHTREQIAREKAGIMRSGKPAVCGDEAPPITLIDYAKQHKVPIYYQTQDFHYKVNDLTWDWYGKQQIWQQLPLPRLNLTNASTSLMVLELLTKRFPVDHANIVTGLQRAWLPARLQIISGEVIKVFDMAHNSQATTLLARTLQDLNYSGKTIAVVSMLASKDPLQMLAPMINSVDSWHIAELAESNSIAIDQLSMALKTLNATHVTVHQDLAQAYQVAGKQAQARDCIVAFGSIYAVAELYQLHN